MADQAIAEGGGMSEPNRLVGVFVGPRKVFEDLAARPRWIIPVVLSMILGLGYMYEFNSRVGWMTMMRQQIESNPRFQQMSQEQVNQIMEQQAKFGPVFGYISVLVFAPLSVVVIAAILMGIFRLLGNAAELKYKQALGITSYAMLPGVLFVILAMLVMLVKEPADFDLQNPLMFNIGAFLDKAQTPAWLHSLASSIDLFTIWMICLLGLGFSILCRKMSFGRGVALVIAPWIVWILLKIGWAAIFG